ncbi:MAG TPA: hypothetical protein PLX97_03645 [Gemmatales bacterium]|nr:hypothetical protein [Gemmatales bacterium]
MPTLAPLPASDALNQFYLEARARLLEVAATLDRIDRGQPDQNDPRLGLLRQALHELDQSTGKVASDRAEQLQLLFSRPYDANWLKKFEPTR